MYLYDMNISGPPPSLRFSLHSWHWRRRQRAWTVSQDSKSGTKSELALLCSACSSTCYTLLRLKLGSKTDLLYMDTVRAVPTQIPKYTVPWSQMGPAILLQSQTYYLDNCRTIVQCIYVDFALCFDIIIRNVCTAVSLHLPESVPWAFLTCDDAMLKKEM